MEVIGGSTDSEREWHSSIGANVDDTIELLQAASDDETCAVGPERMLRLEVLRQCDHVGDDRA